MKNVTPFTIRVAQDILDDLQFRLGETRWTDEPENAGWNYGTNPAYLKQLVTYWQTEYDWRKQEAALNAFPQFLTEIDGIKIHFIYVKGKGKNPRPLLLTHGWPDSFYRYYKVIPLLTDPGSHGGDPDQSFDVIVPSMPGFGFSGRAARNGDQIAVLWAKLMKEVLGYSSFYAAGGDMGTPVTKSLANQYPQLVKAIHLTDVGYPNGSEDWGKMTAAEQAFGKFIQYWWYTEGAYNMIQSTKPQTLGYGLNDSPVGLASWILEKFNSWSDNKGDIENSFSKDELITNIMIYWVSETINSSIRMYLETARASYSGHGGPKPVQRVELPTGVALFPGDAQFPEEWANRMVNVRRFTKMPKGGHFAAMEEPALWTAEITGFFYSNEL
jgi:pimeloyl-ACP methyl ester carboxylesterase